MSWPSTDFEAEIQDELDRLRARNKLLEDVATAARDLVSQRRHHLWPSGAGRLCSCAICRALASLDEEK